VEIAGERRARVDLSGLKDELSNIYYQLSLAADNVEYHKLNHYSIQGDKRFYFMALLGERDEDDALPD